MARNLTPAKLNEITSRLGATAARRATTTGEDLETASRRTLIDFTAEWPGLAAAMLAAAK